MLKVDTHVSDSIAIVPLAVIQITLFPKSGICFGFTYYHVLADGNAFHGFMKSWASIAKFGSDTEFLLGLKELVIDRRGTQHTSSFMVTCTYIWVCILKDEDNDDDDELVHFVFTTDCRECLDAPIPATYFGNCIAFCFEKARCSQLMQEKYGFFIAVESIGEAIATWV
ncbi:anthocyanin 5-aromatic acyltransferase-like [Cornus florida]|uniref:anthocyanin 5-aromatic acyltransferase-like n=1 Tax=Cornus florida TaxID=4283 RepID=UPI0028963830|nr:anthocyanin 5-aromatic acyltransferase-like [Cornus florida]